MIRYSLPRLALLAAAALAAELTVLETWSVAGARPEALLCLAGFAALFAQDTRQGLLSTWCLGLLKDASSAGPLGLYALLFVLCGWIVLQARQVLFRESPVTLIGVAFCSALGVGLLGACFVGAGAGRLPLSLVLGRSFLSALLTAGLALPLHVALLRGRALLR